MYKFVQYYYCPTSNHSHKHMERSERESVDVLYNHKITDVEKRVITFCIHNNPHERKTTNIFYN